MDPGASAGLALIGVAWLVFNIYCAVRTAMNGRWGLFILGWFCGVAWWYGAFAAGAAPGYSRSEKKRFEQMKASRAPGGSVVPNAAAITADGRCPSCGKKGPHAGPRCTVCGHFFGE